jgi:UDP-N-acetylmuramate dehydrogenase
MPKQTIDFSQYSSIKIGGSCEVDIICDYKDYTNQYIIGGANNLLVSPATKQRFAILSDKYNYIHLENNILIVGAKVSTADIIRFCRKNNLGNLEFLSKLPGTIGGVVKMNAGLKDQEIFNFVDSINIDGTTYSKDMIKYKYRQTNIKGVVYEVRLKVIQGFSKEKIKFFNNLRANQPKGFSAGSCFKNPPNDSAGRLIELAKLKGYRVGDMIFSPMHANFLINLGEGTFEDSLKLICLAQQEVKDRFDISLETEIIIII